MAEKQVDVITLDIIKDSLLAAGEEIFTAIARTSKSPIIYECLDFASGLTDDKGRNDGFLIRRCAVENNVTMFTALETVRVLLNVLEETTMGVSTIDAE